MSDNQKISGSAIVTDAFRDKPDRYVRRIMSMWFGRWWWTMAVPVLVCVALSAVNAVWIFVAMMILFLLVPGIIAMVYYNYALTPRASMALADRTVTLRAKSLVVRMVDSGKEEVYTPTDIRSVEDSGKRLIVRFHKPQYSHIAIPMTAIPEDCRADFVTRIMAFSGRPAEEWHDICRK